MRLAVIPARGGSKRIPHKNIRPFHGRPMIAWAIGAARASGLFEKIVVSTDDAQIGTIASDWGAEVPFARPTELADDHTGVMSVVAHAIDWHAARGFSPDPVCLIYATASLLEPDDLARGFEILESSRASFAVSTTTFASPIQRALKRADNGRITMFYPEHYTTRSQDLPEAFHDTGQFCWGRADAWRQSTSIFLSDCVPVHIPRFRVQDIDTLEDWERAELVFGALSKNKEQN